MKKSIFAILIVLFSFTVSAQSFIKTKVPVIVDSRTQRKAIVKMEVRPSTVTTEGQYFLVIDYDLKIVDSLEVLEPISSKQVFWTNQQIDTMNSYLESNYSFLGFTRTESERKRMREALFLTVTQTELLDNGKTFYGLRPEDWELAE